MVTKSQNFCTKLTIWKSCACKIPRASDAFVFRYAKENLLQINFQMKCQRVGEMYSAGQENKNEWIGCESCLFFIRFQLAKVRPASTDKQTVDLTFKHVAFLTWLLSTGEGVNLPSHCLPTSWKSQLLLISCGAGCEEHWWLIIKRKKFHPDRITKGSDRDTKEMKKLKEN